MIVKVITWAPHWQVTLHLQSLLSSIYLCTIYICMYMIIDRTCIIYIQSPLISTAHVCSYDRLSFYLQIIQSKMSTVMRDAHLWTEFIYLCYHKDFYIISLADHFENWLLGRLLLEIFFIIFSPNVIAFAFLTKMLHLFCPTLGWPKLKVLCWIFF